MGKKIFLFTALVMGGALCAFSDDGALKMALDEANRGETEKAIADLQKLEASSPADGRIPLSLGLLYKDANRADQAIAELEKADALSSSLQGTYALGLLYESKWVQTDQEAWKAKAITVWEKYLRDAPLDDAHRPNADKHLRRLRNNG
jgi:tetratricopeptide (TPR) repeat protein